MYLLHKSEQMLVHGIICHIYRINYLDLTGIGKVLGLLFINLNTYKCNHK